LLRAAIEGTNFSFVTDKHIHDIRRLLGIVAIALAARCVLERAVANDRQLGPDTR
jgi:hypothetical protein